MRQCEIHPRRFALDKGDLVHELGAEDVEVARLQLNSHPLDAGGIGILRPAFVPPPRHVRIPALSVDECLAPFLVELGWLETQHGGELALEANDVVPGARAAHQAIPREDVQVRTVAAALVVGAEDGGPIASAVRLVTDHGPLVDRQRGQRVVDAANDRRAFELAERSNEAMSKLSEAVAQNTRAIEHLVNHLGKVK